MFRYRCPACTMDGSDIGGGGRRGGLSAAAMLVLAGVSVTSAALWVLSYARGSILDIYQSDGTRRLAVCSSRGRVAFQVEARGRPDGGWLASIDRHGRWHLKGFGGSCRLYRRGLLGVLGIHTMNDSGEVPTKPAGPDADGTPPASSVAASIRGISFHYWHFCLPALAGSFLLWRVGRRPGGAG